MTTTTTTPDTSETFENVTIYMKSEFMGNVVKIRAKVAEVERGVRWAQYTDAVKITWRGPRQRKDRQRTMGYEPWFVIVQGDGPEPEDMFGEPQVDPKTGVGVAHGRYAGFDPRWISDFATMIRESDAVVIASSDG